MEIEISEDTKLRELANIQEEGYRIQKNLNRFKCWVSLTKGSSIARVGKILDFMRNYASDLTLLLGFF